ncbi:drug/metabolite transporter (DMT)-like permease [Allocatelliglobosispora scoriae]|uniref:Drug/metabolite transporter (DMT)-like permease n=1 Tax=Allocatelliglobosispora scoriae TaxID=643052 RepID=A0A841C2K6_9ACTN|nr:DMT family transporter [Allocatelliglobosispora scoriae]MBB5873200.1 drug/metabolite transporter (DMT)-like permease [Allocatelliglobosispora scoriae]
MIASIALGLLAALLFATAGALQHSVTRRVALARPPGHGAGWLPVLGLLGRVLRSPVWLAGLACNVLGFAAHATALHLGSITIVQALLAVQLMFALPLATARTGSAPLARDWIGTICVCAGIGALVATRGSVPQTVERATAAPVLALAAVLLMTGLVAVARTRRHSPTRTALVGVAAGTGFSVTAAFTVIVTDDLARGMLLHWPLACLGLAGLIAALLVQEAFASGSFPTALTAMTIADPVMSWVWGAVLFDARPPASPAALAGLAASGWLIAVGVALLAYSPTVLDVLQQPVSAAPRSPSPSDASR